MRDILIVANWKANKTKDEAWDWFEKFEKAKIDTTGKEIIICPPYTLLAKANYLVSENNLKLKIGAQDVSEFETGAYTGEISASQIKEFVQYVIIGHSERREYFHESDEALSKKVSNAISANVLPIFCVQSENTKIPIGVKIVAYEPIAAIGTGNSETPVDAEKIAKTIKDKNKEVAYVLYGGSVTDQNVKDFINMPNISGVLIGGASLDSPEFIKILQAC